MGAVGTGIGVLGWVTFLGGAILWIKAAKSELPATESVALIPKSVLLAQGAEVGALAVAVAVVAVAFLYMVDHFFRRRQIEEWKAFRLGAAKEMEEILIANVASAADEAASAQRQAAESRKLAQDAPQQEQVATDDKRRADAAWEGYFDAQRQLARHRERTKAQGKSERRWRKVTIGILLLGVAVVFALITGLSLFWECIALFGVALLGTVLSFLVLLRERWVWFGVAAFLTVSTVLTAGTYFKTIQEPKVEPAAVLREGAGPVCGFFVAQTSTHIYLGTYGRKVVRKEGTVPELAGECAGTKPLAVTTDQQSTDQPPTDQPSLPARLMSIPIDEVTDTAIGPPLVLRRQAEEDDAPSRSVAMALDLCERRVVPNGTSSQASGAKPSGCTEQQKERLRREVAALAPTSQ